MRQSYNGAKLELEYLASPVMEVEGFFESQYNTYTSNIKMKTKGWSVYKQEFIQSCKNKAEEELREDMKEIFKPSREELSQIYKATKKLSVRK